MSEHRYILQPYKGPNSRIKCPECGKAREFARYLDTETGELLPDHVGRCNREDSCGYHFTPKQYFDQLGAFGSNPGVWIPPVRKKPVEAKEIQFLPVEMVEQTMTGYERNFFYGYLESLFGAVVTPRLMARYFVGSSRHWKGANIFWQIDVNGNVRQCKIMLYDRSSGRRVKSGSIGLRYDDKLGTYIPDVDNGDKICFAGKRLLKDQEANLQQCFFGEHLLSEYPDARIAIVESEKTAVIASVYFPKLIWLATGGKNGARWTDPDVCKVLSRREVILFPDLGAFDTWTERGNQVKLACNCRIMVSDLLERGADAEDRAKGLDLADYLVKRDDGAGWAISDHGYPIMWDYAI